MSCTAECFSKFPRHGPAERNFDNHFAVPKLRVRFGFTLYAIHIHVENHKTIVKAKIESWDPKHTESAIFKSCRQFPAQQNVSRSSPVKPPYRVMHRAKYYAKILHNRMYLEVSSARAYRRKLRQSFSCAQNWRKIWFHAIRDTSSC